MVQNKTDNYVVSELSPPLLGHQAIEQLKLLARVQEVQETPSPIHKYPKLFTGLGMLSLGHYCIKLKEGSKPHSLNAARRVYSSSINGLSQTKAQPNRATWCDSWNSGANSMVFWNSHGPQTEQPGKNMC